MKIHVKTLTLSLLVLMQSAQAKSFIPTQSNFYYRLGGGSSLAIPAINTKSVIKLGASMNSNLLPNCYRFNPTVSIKNSLKGLKNKVNGLENEVVTNLTNAVYGYPLARLQQSLPGVYDILQNQTLFTNEEVKVKVKRCEAIKSQVMKGQSPLDGLISITDSQGWIEAATKAKTQEVDINNAEKNINANHDEYGLPWIHRNEFNNHAGGKNQVPIKIINDVIIAGYNLLASPGSALDSITAPPNETSASFVRFWSKPTEAAKWGTTVLGDLTFSKSEDTSKNNNKVGIGLTAVLQSCPHITNNGNTCVANVAEYVWNLVDGKEELTPTNLAKLSSSNMAITADIFTTIQSLPREQQIIAVSKLSEDIAIQNLLEEALSLRNILYAGFQVQEVQNLKPIRDAVKNTIAKLNTEIQSLAFESNIRKQMATRTAQTILSIREDVLAKSEPDSSQTQGVLKNGAIYTNNSDEKKGGA